MHSVIKDTPGEITYLNLAGMNGSRDAGNVIVPGTPIGSITGSSAAVFDFYPFPIVQVPEPTMAHGTLILCAAILLRRRTTV